MAIDKSMKLCYNKFKEFRGGLDILRRLTPLHYYNRLSIDTRYYYILDLRLRRHPPGVYYIQVLIDLSRVLDGIPYIIRKDLRQRRWPEAIYLDTGILYRQSSIDGLV